MRISEIARKEIVDMNEGSFWGPVGKADLLIDHNTGEIISLLLLGGKGFMGIKQTEEVSISWSNVYKIGKDALIINIKEQ